MSEILEDLTSENLVKKFGSRFDLVNYAIHYAEGKIRRGDEMPHHDLQNLATIFLEEIAEKNMDDDEQDPNGAVLE